MDYKDQDDGVARQLLRAKEDLLSQVVQGPKHVMELFRGLENEDMVKVVSLQLDGHRQVLDCEVVGMGRLSAPLLKPRAIVEGALGKFVRAIIVVLNHPRGNAKPTRAEAKAYDTLVRLGAELGFHVLDMVIVAKDDWFSFVSAKERGA